MTMIKISVCLGLGLLVIVLVMRMMLFPNYQHKVTPCSPDEGIDYIELTSHRLSRFQEAIRLQTVSYSLHENNKTAMELMIEHIISSYPLLHTSTFVKREVFNMSILYIIEGTDPSIKPVLFAGHYDVVPVEEEKWSFSPFSGAVEGGVIYGRGTLDNKNTVFGILEALEYFVVSGKRLKRSLYFAVAHDEEVLGFNGAKIITQELKRRGVQFAFMLDEGCVVLKKGEFPGVNAPVGLIGVAEKGFVTLELLLEHEGGHASSPPLEGTAIDIMANAIMKLKANPLPTAFGRGVEVAMLEHAAQSQSIPFRILSTNLWFFSPLLSYILSLDKVGRATISTTVAFTMIDGGVKNNVLPNTVRLIINSRLIPGDTPDDLIHYITKVIGDPRIKVSILNSRPASPISSTESEGYNILHHTIKQIHPYAVVVPALLMGSTDSKHYQDICDDVYRFTPSYLSPNDIKMFHGHNEVISIKNYEQTINFYYHLIRNLDTSHEKFIRKDEL